MAHVRYVCGRLNARKLSQEVLVAEAAAAAWVVVVAEVEVVLEDKAGDLEVSRIGEARAGTRTTVNRTGEARVGVAKATGMLTVGDRVSCWL
jgi:hypothetical protein